MVTRKTRRAARHHLKTNHPGSREDHGVGNRRRVVGLGPYSVGVITLGALVILAVLVVWGTSHLISSADQVERQFVSVPDLPAPSEMPSALVPVLTAADQALRRSVAESADPGTIAQAAGRLGQLYQANNYGENAALCYELAMTQDAENPRWSYLLAVLRQERGENTSVTELLERTVDLAPEYAPAWLKLADNQFKQGLFDQARASYERRLVLSVGDPYASLGLARSALARSEWELAERYLERVTEADAFAAICTRLLGLKGEELTEVLKYLNDFGYETTDAQAAAMLADLDEGRKRQILDHMAMVAKADGEIDARERRLLEATAQRLGFN